MSDHFKPDVDDSGLFKIPEEDVSPSYLIPEKVYQILKWVALIFLPALAVFIGTVGPQWGMSSIEPIVITINAIGLFIGTCIGLSQITSR
jgi:hypothetical protein